MKTHSVLAAFGLVASFLAACSGGSSGSVDSISTASPGGGASVPGSVDSDGGGSTGVEPGVAEVSVACGAWFDAAGAFRTRCGQTPLRFDTFPAAKPAALATCDARAKNPGSGYTNAYYDRCRTVLETAGCEDYSAIVEACWTPTGTLAKGAPCAADDQCGDGLACETPLGSKAGTTCGTCDYPVFGSVLAVCGDYEDATKDRVRCPAGTLCEPEGTGTDRCYSTIPTDPDAATVPVGSKCGPGPCADGSRCASPGGTFVCTSLGVLGDKCDYSHQPCSNWLVCGGTNTCELPAIPRCN